MVEIWKKVNGFPYYEVSSHGKIKNVVTGYMLSDRYRTSGYAIASLYIGKKKSTNKYVHRLVAEAFILNPNNYPTVNHIDFDKKNNKIENLEWATQSQQMLHNRKKTNKKTITNSMRKVWQMSLDKKTKIKLYNSCLEAAKVTGCDHSTIIKVCKGTSNSCGGFKWKYDQDFDEKIKGEIWKDSEKYNTEISNKGRIKLPNGRISYGNETAEGYLNIGITVETPKTYFLHRLVAELFIDNPNNLPTVNHIDKNKKNNAVENLEWATMSDQQNHLIKNNFKPDQGKRRTCKVTQLNMNGDILKEFDSVAEAARVTGCNKSHISQVCKGKEPHCKGYKWKYTE